MKHIAKKIPAVCVALALLVASALFAFGSSFSTHAQPSRASAVGNVTEYAVPGSDPWGTAFDSSGRVWVALPGCDLAPSCPSSTPPGKLALFDPAAQSWTTVVSLPAGYGQPAFVAVDHSGKVWFTQPVTNAIGMYDPVSTAVAQWAIPTPAAGPWDIAVDSGGKVWFTEHYVNQVASFDPGSQTFHEIATPASNSNPYGIVVDASDNIWFTENTDSVALIGEYTRQGVLQEYKIRTTPTGGTGLTPHMITVDPSGNIWWSEGWVSAIGTLNVAAAQPGTNNGVTEYPYTPSCGSCGSHTSGISADSQGLIWLDDSLQNTFGSFPIGGGSFSFYNSPSGGHPHDGLTVDSLNRVWFDEEFANKLAVAIPSGSPTPTATSMLTSTPTPTVTPGTVLGTDTFQRANQSLWGTASGGQTWGGDANSQKAFSIAGNAGLVSNTGGTTYSAVLGPTATNAEVYATASISSFTNSNIGDVLRWADGNNWYKAYLSGASLIIQKKVAGTTTTLASVPFAATSGTSYTIHFRVVGSTLTANAWASSGSEPGGWMVTASDSTLTSGFCGMRILTQSGTATVTSFQADIPGGPGSPTPTPTSTSTPPPSGTAAADSFNRSVTSGWGSADTGGWWTPVGSPWSWSVSPGAGNVNVSASGQEQAYLSSFTTQDVDMVEKVVLPRCSGSSTNCDAFVLGRYAPAYTPTYYRVGVVQGAGGADMLLRAQRSDGTSLGSDLDTGLPASNGAVVWLHVQFQGVNPTAVRARAWLDGTSEPSTWLLNTTDSTSAEQQAGMVGVQLRNEDSGTGHIFQVESYQASGTATPVSVTPNPSGSTTAHWLYVVDDGQVYMYNIDNNHALVKQFPIPEAGKRGVAVAPSRGLLYVSECGMSNCSGKNGSLLAYDLVHDVVAWIANYSFGVDQLAVTPDGSTIYMPHGADSGQGYHSIIDASDGKVTGTITTGTDGHNTIVSLDGTQVYLAGYTGSNFNYAHVVNTATNQVTLNAGPTVNGVRPFTVNGTNTLMFTTSTDTCGFQVLSLTSGNVLYTVPFSGSCSWTVSNAPSHGISLSPDEKRVYVMDAPLDQLEVYDVSGLPASAPSFVASVPLTSLSGSESPCQTYCEREGWVLNDLSGRYVYVGDTGNVVDTNTLSVVATLPALQNTRQLVEIDWANGLPGATSTRFGLGRVTASPTPTPTPTATPSVTPTPSPTPSPTVTVTATPSATPGSTLAQDSFARPSQAHWGMASDGQTWGGDANTLAVFSIVNNTGQVSSGSGTFNAVLGPAASDAEVLFSGSMSGFSNANLGAVLRWTNGSNWYKAYINGTTLVVQKRVNGATTMLGSVPFAATAGTSYTLRFRVVGTTLFARVWQSGSAEPATWMVMVTDTSLSSGFCGLRMQIASGAIASYTSFLATLPAGGTPSPTPTPSPSPSPTPSPSATVTVTATPSATPGSTLAQDTFGRPNQALWGTASDGQTWGGNANTASVFSIVNNTGRVSNTTTTVSAVLGPVATNAEVVFSGSLSSYTNNNLGAVLRWTNGSNWYKAYINGTSLVVQKDVNGATTMLGSVPFAATAGTSYTLRFRVVGTTLFARVWQSGSAEPATWMVMVTDTSLSSGFCGLRLLAQGGAIASYTSFLATAQ